MSNKQAQENTMEQLNNFFQSNAVIRKGVVSENREINDLLKKLDQLK